MAKGTFRFYEELNDHLPQHQKKVDVETEFFGKRCIKETIEDFGVPPSSVDMVLVNGMPAGFQYILKEAEYSKRIFNQKISTSTDSIHSGCGIKRYGCADADAGI
jgi:hypothetical protein